MIQQGAHVLTRTPFKLWPGTFSAAALWWLVPVNVAIVVLHAAGLPALSLALAAAAPLTLAILRRPQRGLLLLAALAPLDGLLVILPVPTFVSGWKQALVLFVVVATFVCPMEARSTRATSRPGWLPGLVALLVLGTASAVFVGGLQAFIGLRLTFFYALLAWAAWRCPLNRAERDRLVTILLGTAFAAAVVGLGQQALGPEGLAALGYEYNVHIRTAGGILRSMGTFQQAFGLGFYLMVVLLVAIPVVLAEPERLRTKLFFLLVPVYALGLLSSLVRAAWMGLAAGLVYLGYRRFPALLFLLPLAVVALAMAPADFGGAATSARSFGQRTAAWSENVGQVVEHPLGVGMGSSGSALDKASSGNDEGGFVPDNYYIKTVYDLGVVGLWLFVLLLVAIFTSLRRITSLLTGVDAGLAMGVAAMVVAAAVASLTATYFEMFPMDLLFWLLVGVVESMRRSDDAASVPPPVPVPLPLPPGRPA